MAAIDDAEADARRTAEAMWARDEASQRMGMEILSLGLGHCAVTMTVRDDMINGHGTCHGSYVFALADSAFALACNSHGPVCVASDCQISFLRPVELGQRLTATATETFRSGRNGVYDVVVAREDDKTVAVFRGKSRAVAERKANGPEDRE